MISIIVPVYNVEKYLKHCIDSILNSTYQDFELILVDDGSTDGSGAICDDYADKDSRVKVIHGQNQWVSEARNNGLEAATGEYISFVDGDDAIHPRMLEVLHDALLSGDYDYSMIYGVRVQESFDCDDSAESRPIDAKSQRIISQEEYMKNLACLEFRAYQYHVVWNKLYKASLVKDIYFNKLTAQDVEWSSRVCLTAKQGILIEAELYYYIQHENSIMHAGTDRSIALINTYNTCLNNIPAELTQYRAMMLKTLYTMIFYCRHLYRNSPKLAEVNNRAAKVYRETRTELLHSDLSLSRKCRMWLYYYCPTAYELIYRLLNTIG